MSSSSLASGIAIAHLKRWLVCLTTVSLFPFLTVLDASAEDVSVSLGVLPYAPPTRLEEVFAPVAAHLSASLGSEVRFRTATGSGQFLERLRDGAYDVALVQPFYYVLAADELGYRPLVRTDTPFVSVIVVREDAELERVEQLVGQTVASTPRYSPPSILVRQALREAGIDPERDVSLSYMNSPTACLHQVRVRAAAACIVGEGHLPAQTPPEEALRVVMRTPPLPGMVFVIREELPEVRRAALTAALLSLDETPVGRALLDSLGATKLVTADDADYDGVRALLGRLEEPWLPVP